MISLLLHKLAVDPHVSNTHLCQLRASRPVQSLSRVGEGAYSFGVVEGERRHVLRVMFEFL